jgi:hypothetical protein
LRITPFVVAHYTAGIASHALRQRNYEKRRPSSGTGTRPEGALGSLWTHDYDSAHYGAGDGWSWTPYPITKITAKRVFIAWERAYVTGSGRVEPARQYGVRPWLEAEA